MSNTIYTLLNNRVLGASLLTDAWSLVLKITIGIKMADADREVLGEKPTTVQN